MNTRVCLGAASGCSNTTLLEQAAQGDQLAWSQLVNQYDHLVRSVAASFRLQAADVSDAAQTTWLRLLQNLHSIRDPERLAGWLQVTATREALMILRRACRDTPEPMIEESPDLNPAVDGEASVVAREAARDLWRAVAQLPPRQQNLVIALFKDELSSYDDVAAKCAMPVGSIGPTRARALSRLQRELAQRDIGPATL